MKIKLKRISIMLSVMLFILITSATARAQDQVLTLYFMGTTMKSDAYLAANSGFNRPELLSTIYSSYDKSEAMLQTQPNFLFNGRWYPQIGDPTGRHHKYIINGAGTSPESNVFDLLLGLLGTAEPNIGIRNWAKIKAEGLDALSKVHANHPNDDVIVNLLGFSRGGISIMQMARELSNVDEKGDEVYGYVKKINMLAFDPVPGGLNPIGRFGDDFVLSQKVNQYIGIYAEDERTYQFEPVVPKEASRQTKMLLVRLPGSHETMVGNRQVDGHSFTLVLSDNREKTGYRYVEEIALGIAEQLLTSFEWGEVPYVAPVNNIVNKSDFSSRVASMWSEDYSQLPRWGFYPGFGSYDLCYANLKRDHQLRLFTVVPPQILPLVADGRLVFIAQKTHSPEWKWTWPCFAPWPVYAWYPNVEQVYWLNNVVPRITANTWNVLQSFRGTPPVTDLAPVPDMAVLPDITVNCSAAITQPPTATDDVDGQIQGVTTDPLNYTGQGVYSITWTYTDSKNQSVTQTQTVVVKDTGPPVADEEPLPVIVGQCEAEITSVPTATDNCAGTIPGTTADPLSYTLQGEYIVTWTYYDGHGNTSSQTQSVLVQDTTPPVIKVTANPDVLWTKDHDDDEDDDDKDDHEDDFVEVYFNVEVMDNCIVAPTVVLTSVVIIEPDDEDENDEDDHDDREDIDDDDIQGADIGTDDYSIFLKAESSDDYRLYIITYTATDYAGNSASASATVTVPHKMDDDQDDEDDD